MDVFRGFGSIDKRLPVPRKCCAQFIVSRERVRARPLAFYQRYYDWLVKHTDTVTGKGLRSSWMTSRLAEWTWDAVFDGQSALLEYLQPTTLNDGVPMKSSE